MYGILFSIASNLSGKFVVIAVIIAIFSYIGILNHNIHSLKEQLKVEQQNLKVAEDNNTKLLDSIELQNNAINKQKDILDKALVDKQNIQNSVNKLNLNDKSRVTAILNEKKPVTCTETKKYLVDGVKDLKW